ncbi:MAG: ABC transporter ATP-binding protein [Patescibacteria group bacterium]
MNYTLDIKKEHGRKTSYVDAAKKLWPLLCEEKGNLIMASVAIFLNSALNLVAPMVVAHVIDTYIPTKDYHGVFVFSGILLTMYVAALFTSYFQTRWMGGVGQRVLFNLRSAIFNKLQELPVAFFNQNKAGDLISRINNDTDKLNQFFSQSLMQFIGSIFIMIGAGVFLLSLNLKLGAAALAPALALFIFTRLISGWVKRKNTMNLSSVGGMSSEIQESLNNFKVIVAFNRRDYFRQRFEEANNENYKTSVKAGLANNLFTPVFGLSSNLAQLVILAFGIYLIMQGEFTLGLLISFISYANNFYNPLRQLAALWANFQVAMAGWDRIAAILDMKSDLKTVDIKEKGLANAKVPILEFKGVKFGYPNGKEVLHDVNFKLEKGKTYALVGPTGGGKTTTASLMARLYDPTEGVVMLDGKDIRSYEPNARTDKIGFILQEPFLFTGSVRENILYGNVKYQNYSNEELEQVIKEANLETLLGRFENGLDTKVMSSGDAVSLGQRQLIAFIRAVLRNPDLLILDEATANVDTVTEQLLEDILKKLSKETTRVIIAHRLNTIENADEIFFVNSGEVIRAGSMEHAVEMLLHGKRKS